VVNLISSECIEERIFNLVAQKKALFEGVFDGRTVDIRFDSTQTASFMEKMKTIFTLSESRKEELQEDSEWSPSHRRSTRLRRPSCHS
jgi:hypothetical protein